LGGVIVTVGALQPQGGVLDITPNSESAKPEKPGTDSLIAVSRIVLGPAHVLRGAFILTALKPVSPGSKVKRTQSGLCINPSSGNVAITRNVEGGQAGLSLLMTVIPKLSEFPGKVSCLPGKVPSGVISGAGPNLTVGSLRVHSCWPALWLNSEVAETARHAINVKSMTPIRLQVKLLVLS
jgi:hypothetical protein